MAVAEGPGSRIAAVGPLDCLERGMQVPEDASERRPRVASCRRPWCMRKLMPMMGKETAAWRKHELVAGKHQRQLPSTPALDGRAIQAQQARSRRWRGGGMWNDAVGGARVDQKTPARLLINDVQQVPSGDGVEPGRAS